MHAVCKRSVAQTAKPTLVLSNRAQGRRPMDAASALCTWVRICSHCTSRRFGILHSSTRTLFTLRSSMDLVVAPTVLLLSIQMARFLHLCWQTCAFSKQILWRSTDIQLTTVKHQDHVSPLPKHRFPNFDFASHESGLPAVVACLAAHYKVRPFNANV